MRNTKNLVKDSNSNYCVPFLMMIPGVSSSFHLRIYIYIYIYYDSIGRQ